MANNNPAPLVGGAIEEQIGKHLEAIAKEDGVLRRAASTAMPGPLKDAFAISPNITVGPYSIRPFYDIDYEFLEMLNHPLDRMFKDVMEGKVDKDGMPETKFLPRGLPAWQAFWMMTRPVDDTEALLATGAEGIKELNQLARAEFGRLQTKALGPLFEAVMQQVALSNSTAVRYDYEKEGEKTAENPSRLNQPRTDSAG